MTKTKHSIEHPIERIMAAPVKGLVRLPEHSFDLVLALVLAARYGARLQREAQGKPRGTAKARGSK